MFVVEAVITSSPEPELITVSTLAPISAVKLPVNADAVTVLTAASSALTSTFDEPVTVKVAAVAAVANAPVSVRLAPALMLTAVALAASKLSNVEAVPVVEISTVLRADLRAQDPHRRRRSRYAVYFNCRSKASLCVMHQCNTIITNITGQNNVLYREIGYISTNG